MKKTSPHAKTILALLNNARQLCCVHHEYCMARDVMKAMQKIAGNLGFDIDNQIFEYMLSSIGSKNPASMSEQFDRFASSVIMLDKKLDKEPLAGDKKDVRRK